MNIEFSKDYVQQYFNVGEKIYICGFSWHWKQGNINKSTIGRSFSYRVLKPAHVIEDIIDEVDNVLILTDEVVKNFNLTSTTCWWSISEEGEDFCGYQERTKENQWGFKKLPKEAIERGKVVNQFVWPKETSFGHGIQLREKFSYQNDQFFPTYEEAFDAMVSSVKENIKNYEKYLIESMTTENSSFRGQKSIIEDSIGYLKTLHFHKRWIKKFAP